MRLTAADVNRIIEDNIPKPAHAKSADDYVSSNAEHQFSLVQGFLEKESTSAPRQGEVLPPAPKNLATNIFGPNDFGLPSDNELPAPQDMQGLQTSLALPQQDPNAHLIPRALLGVDLTNIHSRSELIYGLSQNLPLNEMGLPKILFSPDIIDYTRFTNITPSDEDAPQRYQECQDILDIAQIHINYAEGFPALPNGDPLWGRLPFEDATAFGAFLQYCELPGARQTSMLAGFTKEQTLGWYHEHYWSIRSKCFDMMHNVHMAKLREQRILSCEDNHYKKSAELFARLSNLDSDINWEILKSDPKAYVDTLEKVVKLQRVSLGLSNLGAGNTTRDTKTESLEVAMRKASSTDAPALKMKDDQIGVRALLRSPDALATAQELIIRMTQTTTRSSESSEASE